MSSPAAYSVRGLTSAVARSRIGEACGKSILLGEHAVVYGTQALAVGIDRGVRAVAKPSADRATRLSVKSWGTEVTTDDPSDLGRALRALVEEIGLEESLAVEAVVDLPPGGGLGCSAALGVAVARALDPEAPNDVTRARVMAWERVFHSNPSGVDAAVASRGGCLVFSKGAGTADVRVGAPLTLCIGHSGVGSKTAAMVEAVAKLRTERPDLVKGACEDIHELVSAARFAIEGGDRRTLGRLMDLNQSKLGTLGLTTPAIDRMCGLARDHGAFGAKLTGAGGGGSVVAVVSGGNGAWQVLHAWRGAGFEGFVTRVAPTASSVEESVAAQPGRVSNAGGG